MLLSYRNESIGLHCKLIDWFLYDSNIKRSLHSFAKTMKQEDNEALQRQ